MHWRMIEKRKPRKVSSLKMNQEDLVFFYSTEGFIYIGNMFFWKMLNNLFICPSELSQEHKEIDTP